MVTSIRVDYKFLLPVLFVLIQTGCVEPSSKAAEPANSENETIALLGKSYPDRNFEFIRETKDSFEFKSDDDLYIITDARLLLKEHGEDQNRLFKVQKNGSTIYIEYSVSDVVLYNYITNPENASTVLEHDILRVYDAKMNRVYGLNDESRLREKNEYMETQSCTTDNVLGCMEDNCKDAGPILCGTCLIAAKWCGTSLAALCALDVYFEVERDIYCEDE